MGLTNEQVKRYSRHLIMPEVGVEGQEKLINSSVLCIGAGGLGSPLALYLAAAGVGHLGVLDFDVVDFSNLQRQIIHSEKTIGELKVESAKKRILELNSDIKVTTYNEMLTSENAMEIIKDYDVIVDGTDNFATRYLVNDSCVLLGKPNVYGSIFRFEGQVSVFDAKKGPCYRCLYPEPALLLGLVPKLCRGGSARNSSGNHWNTSGCRSCKAYYRTGKSTYWKTPILRCARDAAKRSEAQKRS